MSVIAGILLGPAPAFLAAFIVDLILAFFGHGGITVVGLNTLVIGTEATVGHLAYRLFLYLVGERRVGLLLQHPMEPPVLTELFDELRRRGYQQPTAITVTEAAGAIEEALRCPEREPVARRAA